MFCQSCGTQLNNNARFCPSCGAAAGNETAANTMPAGVERVGYSPVINSPEFLLCAKKYHKQARQAAIIFTILLPFIGALGGAIIGDGSTVGVVIGITLGFASIAFLWFTIAKDKKKKQALPETTDGTISNISYYGSGRGSNAETKYTTAKIIFIDSAGREHCAEIKCKRDIYNYFKVGEVVRYHTKINFPEKYDKSRDNYSVCALCLYKEAVYSDRCPKCDAPLLK